MLPDRTVCCCAFMLGKSQCTYRCVVLPDCRSFIVLVTAESSQCTYRCVALPDMTLTLDNTSWSATSQCTCRCVVLPDSLRVDFRFGSPTSLNAPAGAWCSLTAGAPWCALTSATGLNAPAGAWCSLTYFHPVDARSAQGLNAPAGAWCSLTVATFRALQLMFCLNAPAGAWCSLTSTRVS